MLYWAILIVANIPVYLALGYLIFKDWDDFGNSIYYSLKPDIFSYFSGELGEDWWASAKMWVFILLCGSVVCFEHYQWGNVIETKLATFV